MILDRNFNKLYEFSEYNVSQLFDATENYVVFSSRNDSNDTYTIILDKDGNRVVEPFETGNNAIASIVGDYVVVGNFSEPVEKIINCKTGEITEYECELFSNVTGMMVVKSDGAYYLAHISDPDTLINPFEIAE